MCQVSSNMLSFNPFKSLFGRSHCLHSVTEDIEVQCIDVIVPKFVQLGSSGGGI